MRLLLTPDLATLAALALASPQAHAQQAFYLVRHAEKDRTVADWGRAYPGATNQPPHAWAWAILSDWLQSGRSLAELQRRGGLAKPPVSEPGEKGVLGSGS